MHRIQRVTAQTGIILTLVFLCALCFVSGCNNDGQGNSLPLSFPGSDGTTLQGGATLNGTIVDGDSLVPLDNATVFLGILKTATDAQGNYSFTGIAAGSQTMKVTCQDYEDFSQQVQLTDGQATTQDIAMTTTLDDWLEQGTAYNWQVEAVQADGTVIPGPVWNFTTESARGVRTLRITDGIDQDQAKKVADTFLAAMEPGGFSITSMESINSTSGTKLAYAFILNPAGYIIVPACRADVLPPVLAYSFTTSFSTRHASSLPLLNLLRGDISMRLFALSEKATIQAPYLTKNRGKWDTYLSGKSGTTGSTRAVTVPLITVPTWAQEDPYNRSCPPDPVTKRRCVAGCVATAYSQILNYWKFPGTVAFTSADDYKTITRNIAITASTANFTSLDYNGGSPSDDTIGKICFAMGVLARMNYTSKVSLAYMLGPGKSLTRFGYKDRRVKSYGVSDKIDTAPIIDDLQSTPGRPVFLAIGKVDDNNSFYGGHAIVCDGYDGSNDTFHLNMGWEGEDDGWYSLPSGMPANYTSIAGYVYNLIPPGKGTPASFASRAAVPANPCPEAGDTRVTLDQELLWDDCDGAVSYNCYLWKASAQKPTTPTFSNLPYAGANPGFFPQQ